MNDEDLPRCRACHSKILWAETPKGKRIPIDPEPVPDGNMTLRDRGKYVAPLATVWTHGATEGVKLYKSHFATCPSAAAFRKRK